MKKRYWRTIISLIATVVVLFALGGINVFAGEEEESQPEIVASGYCGAEGNGENLSWTLDSTGLLTISGTGEMQNYQEAGFEIRPSWENFKNEITTVVITEGVTSIGDSAFSQYKFLTSINIPNSVTSIGAGTFEWCTSLTSINIPNSVTSIGAGTFEWCTSLASINIPNSVTSIGESAFSGCMSLASINIPNSVTSIGESAFFCCISLASISIPNSVTGIGEYAFSDCTSLASISLPKSVNSIGTFAFRNCGNVSVLSLNFSPDIFTDELTSYFPSTINANVFVPDNYYEDYQVLFSSFPGVLLSNSEVRNLGSGVHLYGYSLSLDGSIGVNFYMTLESDVLQCANTAYMEFTVSGKTQKVWVKDLSPNKDGYYIFRCDVVAKEMTDEITAQVYLNDNTPIGNAYTYSVQEYAEYILDHSDKYSYEAVDLVKAMLNYGADAQRYFNYHTKNLANSVLPENAQQTSVSFNNLNYFKDGAISPAKVSLTLKSTITLKLYFETNKISNVTSFEYRGKELPTTVSGDYTIVTIEGIPATQFCSKLTIKYYTDESTTAEKLKYCPSNYACIVLDPSNSSVFTDKLKDVVRSLYMFSVAANVYSSSSM